MRQIVIDKTVVLCVVQWHGNMKYPHHTHTHEYIEFQLYRSMLLLSMLDRIHSIIIIIIIIVREILVKIKQTPKTTSRNNIIIIINWVCVCVCVGARNCKRQIGLKEKVWPRITIETSRQFTDSHHSFGIDQEIVCMYMYNNIEMSISYVDEPENYSIDLFSFIWLEREYKSVCCLLVQHLLY